LIVLLLVKPYKRTDVGVMAFSIQISTVLIFYMATCITLFTSLDEFDVLNLSSRVLGFDSIGSFLATMIAISFSFLACFVLFTLYQILTSSRNLQFMRMRSSGQPPELTMKEAMRYHLFLSHVWSSGQDQVAVIKRKLQLTLPGCEIFLDVDDLEDIGNLEDYVEASQCILIFLSKGYFYSANCLRELDFALAARKPLCLVHEKDPRKGGVSLDILSDDCSQEGRDPGALFRAGLMVTTWHRIAVFQQLSLKLIAQKMLHSSPMYMDLPEPPDIYFTHQLTNQTLRLRNKVVLYASMANQGAAEAAQELREAYFDKNLTIISRPRSLLLPKRRRSSIQQELRRSVSNLASITRRASEELPRMPSTVGEGSGLDGSSGSNRRSCSRGSRGSSCNRGSVGRSERSSTSSLSSETRRMQTYSGKASLKCLKRLNCDCSGLARVSREPSQDSVADEDDGETPEGESRRDSLVESDRLSIPPNSQYEEPNPNLGSRRSSKLSHRPSCLSNRSRLSSEPSCPNLSIRSTTDTLKTAAQTIKQVVVPDKNGQVASRGWMSSIIASGTAQAVKMLEQSDNNEPVQDYATHMLLYLNNKTFHNEARHSLSREIRLAMHYGIGIILVHENDEENGGCNFARFFDLTPDDLIRDGLYKKIAVAFHPEPHREISIALLAKELGYKRVIPKAVELVSRAAEKLGVAQRRCTWDTSTSGRANSGRLTLGDDGSRKSRGCCAHMFERSKRRAGSGMAGMLERAKSRRSVKSTRSKSSRSMKSFIEFMKGQQPIVNPNTQPPDASGRGSLNV